VAVIPFHQIVVQLYGGVWHRKLGGPAGAPQRTREYPGHAQSSEVRSQLARLAFALLDQGEISAAGMLSCQRPRRVAVAREINQRQGRAHFFIPWATPMSDRSMG